jgi:UDP-3-O-[3-hydroxymyristoyl] glucosamine N-acyltransferase
VSALKAASAGDPAAGDWLELPQDAPRAVSKAQTVQPFAGKAPQVGQNVFVAPSASVIGDVKLGDGSSVWYGAVIRGAAGAGAR